MARDLEDRLDAAVRRGDAQDLAKMRARPRRAPPRHEAGQVDRAPCRHGVYRWVHPCVVCDEPKGATPVIAIDLGSKHTGWAIRTDQGRLEHGAKDFPLARGETEGMVYKRFRAWLQSLLVKVDAPGKKPVIAFEAPHQRGGAATGKLLGMRSHLLELAQSYGLEVAVVHTGTLKKHATGCGKAHAGKIKNATERRAAMKAAMKRAAARRWKLAREPGSDDEADALCVLAWLVDQIGEP